MKIIRSPRRQPKSERVSTIENRVGTRADYTHRADYADKVVVDYSPEVTELSFQQKKAKPSKKSPVPNKSLPGSKPLAKDKRLAKDSHRRDSRKQSQNLNRASKPSFNQPECEEEFDFDASNLEPMPKDQVFEGPSQSKTRRKSELQADTLNDSFSFLSDPEKKKFSDFFSRGLRLLAMREHSVKEITQKLFDKSEDYSRAEGLFNDKNHPESDISDDVVNSDKAEIADTIFAVIDELVERKYLCDQRFTEAYIRSRISRGFGPVKIKAELKLKGVSNNLIQDHLDEGGASWFDNAESQYQKKYGEAPISDYNTWTKRARFMQSRGFTMEHIHVTVPRVEFD